jgi:hypothetical protein
MPIERFVWTFHAEDRRRERLLDRAEIEHAIRIGHSVARINRGRADWEVHGLCADGRHFVVVYDLPHRGDPQTARIVSLWVL